MLLSVTQEGRSFCPSNEENTLNSMGTVCPVRIVIAEQRIFVEYQSDCVESQSLSIMLRRLVSKTLLVGPAKWRDCLLSPPV